MFKVCLAVSLVALLAAGSASAATLFEEDFSDDLAAAGGNSVLNFAGFDQFTVSGGTVDLIESGDYSIDCLSGGACVDLDGSSNSSGLLSSVVLNFDVGVTYTLTAIMSGNQRDNTIDTGVFGISGGILNNVYSLAGSDTFQTFTSTFTVATATTGSVFFNDDGNDFVGAILDRVTVTNDVAAVPLPASVFLLMGAMGGMLGMRRRKY